MKIDHPKNRKVFDIFECMIRTHRERERDRECIKWDHNRKLELGQMPDEITFNFKANVPFIDFALVSVTNHYEMYLMKIANQIAV